MRLVVSLYELAQMRHGWERASRTLIVIPLSFRSVKYNRNPASGCFPIASGKGCSQYLLTELANFRVARYSGVTVTSYKLTYVGLCLRVPKTVRQVLISSNFLRRPDVGTSCTEFVSKGLPNHAL